MTFIDNCIWRAVPLPIAPPLTSAIVWPVRPKLWLSACPVGSAGAGAHPGVGVDTGEATAVQIPPSGLVKLGWFRRLKRSARNCSFILSVIGKFFIPDKSHWKNPGARRALRPTSPRLLPHAPL